MKYLLDNSVFSQPLRRKPVEAALRRWRDAGDLNCRVSRVSVAEVEWGLAVENQAIRWEKYRQLLEHRLSVLENSAEIWSQFSTLKARQQKRGQPMADLDVLICSHRDPAQTNRSHSELPRFFQNRGRGLGRLVGKVIPYFPLYKPPLIV